MFESIVRSCADMQASLGGCWNTKTRTRIFGNVKMGKNVFIDDEVLIEASKEVMLGDNVVIGPRVVVFNTGYDLVAQKHLDNVIISTGVYIGPGAIICPGVKIEENSVVCPGAARALANCGHKKMFERERARDISICSQFLKKELNCLYVKVE